MKSSRIVCAIAALSLAIGSVPAFAQGSGADPDRTGANNPGQQYRAQREALARDRENQRLNQEYAQRNGRNYDQRNYDQRNYDARRNDGRHNGYEQRYYNARSPEFRRGGHIPREYYNRQYYVNDWRGHHLSAPPRGYQWVQVGSDYVLIALATGLIANLILSQ